MQDTFRHRIAAPVDECVLLGLAEALGELPDQITLQIESGLTDVIQFQRCDDRHLMKVHMFLRAKGVVTRRDGGILRDPLELVVHVSHPEHRVASRTGHHRTDLAEQVCILKGGRVAGGHLGRKQISPAIVADSGLRHFSKG